MTDCTAILCNGELEKSLKNRILACDQLIAVDGGLKYCYEMGLNPDWIMGDFDSASQFITRYPPHKIVTFPRAKDKTDLELTLERVRATKTILFGGLGGRLDQTLAHLFFLLRQPETLFLETENELIFAINASSPPQYLEEGLYESLTLFPLYGPLEEVTIEMEGEIRSWEIVEREDPFTWYIDSSCRLSLKKGEAIVILLKETKRASMATTLQQLAAKSHLSFPHETVIHIHAGETAILPSQMGLTVSLVPFYGSAQGVRTEGLKWNFGAERTTLDRHFLGISNVCLGDTFLVEIEEGEALCLINHEIIDHDMVYL